MAIQDAIGSVTEDLFSGTVIVFLIIVVGLIFLTIVGGIIWWFFFHKKRFDILVKVISKRSGEDRVYFDKGAILNDKKNNVDYLKLWTSHVELELPKFDIMYHTNKGDYIELLRKSQRDFKFLMPPRIDEEYIVRSDGKKYLVADLKQNQIENDITWILERLKVNKSLIDPESVLMKVLSYAPQIMSMAFSMIIIWIVFRYAPQLLGQLSDLIESSRVEAPSEVIGGWIIPLIWKI